MIGRKAVFVLALWMGGLTWSSPGAAVDPRYAELESVLKGTWTIAVGGQERTRQIVVRGFRSDAGSVIVDALYGWSDDVPKPAPARIVDEQGTPALKFTSSNDREFTVRAAGANRWKGNMLQPGGRTIAVTMRRTALETAVTLDGKPSPTFSRDASPTAADVEDAVNGSWVVSVGSETFLRTVNLRTVHKEADSYAVETVYGRDRRNDAPVPVPGRIDVVDGIIVLKITTPEFGTFEVRPTGRERMVGRLTAPDGKIQRAAFTLEGAESVPPPGRGPAKALTLVFLNAIDCPKCNSWWNAIGGGPRDSLQAFLGTPEGRAVKLRHLDFPKWTNTGIVSMWPEDLRWVTEATYVSAGSPRFILIADDVVVANRIGVKQLETQIMPAIRKLSPRR